MKFGLVKNNNQKVKMNWDKIKTIAQFDGEISGDNDTPSTQGGNGDGNNSSTHCVDQRDIGELTKTKPSTSTSLLIESLMQLLCSILENDKKLSEESYKSICEQLYKINLIDDSYTMNEFEDVRGQYQMQIYKIICAVRGKDIPISLPSIGTKPNSVETCWSRYRREFDEDCFIAGGGFGKVFKARHKLDSIEYAVKQIKIHSTTIKLCHLAEVKTIASLNHPNIVQYKAAWLEPYFSDTETTNTKNMIESESFSESILTEHSKTEDYSEYNESIIDTSDSSDFIQFEYSNNTSQVTNSSRQEIRSNKNIMCKYETNSIEKCRPKPKLAILYIQMALCQLTLRTWLDNRNASPDFENYYLDFFSKKHEEINHLDVVHDIFCQMLSGLNYIHSRNIVHHDIKPSNIFLGIESDGKIIAQLGDFGLACPLQNGHRGIALGTPLYAAPEQLNGECNPKSDIYSLGIILLELLLKFNTDMERVRTIENARKGSFPTELNKKSLQLLNSLLNDVNDRLTTKELIEAVRVINLEQNLITLRCSQADKKLKDIKIKELKNDVKVLQENASNNLNEMQRLINELNMKNENIKDLNLKLLKQNDEIEELKNQLKKFENLKLKE